MNRPFAVFCLGLLLLAAGCAADPSLQASPWVETPGYPQGRYVVLPPLHRPEGPVPVCFALHGLAGDAMSYGRLWHGALEGEYLVVAPQAPAKKRMGSWISTWHVSDDRDYLLHVWDEVRAKWNVDARRSMAAGYSAGAAAAGMLASRRRGQLAGLIFHAAGPTVSLSDLEGLHVFILAGERDTGFSPTSAMKLRDRLTGLGIATQMHIVERATHASVYDKVRAAAAWALRGFGAAQGPPEEGRSQNDER